MTRLAIALVLAGCVSEPPAPACAPPHPIPKVSSTEWEDMSPWLSDDRLELYFSGDGTPGYQGTEWDMWRATRTSVDVDFDPPVQITASEGYALDPFPFGGTLYFVGSSHVIGSQIYGAALPITNPIAKPYAVALPELADFDMHPRLSADGLTIVYGHTESPADQTAMDIWMARRTDPKAKFDRPHRVSSSTAARDNAPTISADGQTLWFETYSIDPMHAWIVRAPRISDDDFGPAEPVPELEPPDGAADATPHVLANGRTLVFASTRGSSTGQHDLWIYCE